MDSHCKGSNVGNVDRNSIFGPESSVGATVKPPTPLSSETYLFTNYVILDCFLGIIFRFSDYIIRHIKCISVGL